MKVNQMLTCLYAVVLLLFSFDPAAMGEQRAESDAGNARNKKILYVNSYHKGYSWSDGEQAGAEKLLNQPGIDFRVVYMDAKKNPSEEYNMEAGKRIRNVIEAFKPAVVITADDNAFKYGIVPYFKGSGLPLVFCGINFDASAYGVPFKNVTGILEVSMIDALVKELRPYAKGDRVGFLTGDTLSEHINSDYFAKSLQRPITSIFVKNFSDWKKQFVEIQKQTDVLLVGASGGIAGWNDHEAESFVLREIKVPTGVDSEVRMSLALIGYVKIPEEQGEWAASAALSILNGVQPSEIPITFNKKGKLIINLKLAEKLGIVFKPELLKNAEIAE